EAAQLLLSSSRLSTSMAAASTPAALHLPGQIRRPPPQITRSSAARLRPPLPPISHLVHIRPPRPSVSRIPS
uniref:Uncharacterized protein n=2 Tax=Aegilops tauschii subsp. strangulata TaxID=200361 RepID=A0A453B4W0_AEGTS